MDYWFYIITIVFFVACAGVIISQGAILVLKIQNYFFERNNYYNAVASQKQYFEEVKKKQNDIFEYIIRLDRKINDLLSKKLGDDE